MAVDIDLVERLGPLEARVSRETRDPGLPEAPVHIVVARVDLAGLRGPDLIAVAVLGADAVGLDQHRASGRGSLAQDPEQPERFLDAVQDPKTEDEVELLVEPVELERVEPAIRDGRAN